MKLKKLVRLSMLISLSVVISIIESYIPILNNIVPGLRLGLSNIIIFCFSLYGAIFSIVFMYIAKKIKLLSVVGVSVVGSISHSIGQILIAIFILKNNNVIYYLPYLLILSIPTGVITGLITNKILKYNIEM